MTRLRLLPRRGTRFRISARPPSLLTKAIEALGEAIAEEQRAEDQEATAFSLELPGMPQNLHPILRDEICRISAEAPRNAFHHAGPRRIEFELQHGQCRFRVRIRDDGIGIDRGALGQEGRPGHLGAARHVRARQKDWRAPGSLERAPRRYRDRVDPTRGPSPTQCTLAGAFDCFTDRGRIHKRRHAPIRVLTVDRHT